MGRFFSLNSDPRLRNVTSREIDLLFAISQKLSDGTDWDAIRKNISGDLLSLFKADSFILSIVNDNAESYGLTVAENVDPKNVHAWQTYYQFHDPIKSALLKAPPPMRRRACRISEVISYERLRRTELFNDLLMKDQMRYGMFLIAHEADSEIGNLMVQRHKSKDDFNEQESAFLDLMLPHLRNALRNVRLIAKLRETENFWKDLLEKTKMPLFLLKDDGHVVYRNSHAGALEKELSPENFASFMECVRRLIRGDSVDGKWGKYALSAMTASVPAEPKSVTAVMVDGLARREVDGITLRDMWNLTSRETEICLLMFKGLSGPEIAAILTIAPSTAHTHMKHIFAKMDVSSRSELVYTLLSKYLEA